MFPVEVWKRIFEKIDNPVLLAQLRSVCKLWNTEIGRILLTFPTWKELHDEKVPVFWRQTRFVHSSTTYSHLFRQIYVSWVHFQSNSILPQEVGSSRVEKLLKFSELECITSVDIQGDVLVFATTEGFIYFSHVHDSKNPFFIANHRHSVTEVKICKSKCRHIVASKCINNHIKYWNYMKRMEIPQLSVDQSRNCTNYRTVEYEAFFPSADGFISIYRMESHELIFNWKCKLLKFTSENIVAMENNLILVLDNAKSITSLYKIHTESNENYCTVSTINRGQLPLNIAGSNLKKFKIIENNFIVCLTDDTIALTFCDHPWVSYNMRDIVRGTIKCITGTYWNYSRNCVNKYIELVMGLDTGDIYIYNLDYNRFKKMDQFDFRNAVPVILKCAIEPIIFIDYYITQSTGIFAASKKNVYLHPANNSIESDDDSE